MARYLIKISYDGTSFEGWQSQLSRNTVQDIIEAGIEKITGKFSRVTGAGRTDSGVHALGQTAHFDSETDIPMIQLVPALNSVTPNEIVIEEIKIVADDFHAKDNATGKHYDYLIYNRSLASPFLNRYSWHLWSSLDFKSMETAAEKFIGTHDFTSFCAAGTDIENKVRIIKSINFKKEEMSVTRISVIGNGFLRYMVRIIVGTLVQVGKGRLTPEEIPSIFEAKDRTVAGPTAPACGLFLVKVFY